MDSTSTKATKENITNNSKSRQAENYFRSHLPKPDRDIYTIGEGRRRDIRFRIVNLNGKHIGIYIGLTDGNTFFSNSVSVLQDLIPEVDWSYASSNMLHANKAKEAIWWVGWTEERKSVDIDDLVKRIKLTVDKLAKGALDGEIGPTH